MGHWANRRRGSGLGSAAQGLTRGLCEHLRKYLTTFLAVQRRTGKIKCVEKCPPASEVRRRTTTNGAPNTALPRLVLGWPQGWYWEMLVLVKAKCGEKNQVEIGAVFQSVCAHYVINASVCQVILKSSILQLSWVLLSHWKLVIPGQLPQGRSGGRLFNALDFWPEISTSCKT